MFNCLRFETSLFVASYDSQGYGGGIRPRLHTGLLRTPYRLCRFNTLNNTYARYIQDTLSMQASAAWRGP
jgi:hypothetical protein